MALKTPPQSLLGSALRALVWALRSLILLVVAFVLWIEEWGWRPLAAWAARLARWPPLARLEAALRQTTPRWALALFLVPACALFPLKLAALWLIHRGHGATGVVVIVLAKLLGTALVGRLFVLVEPQLMQFSWLAATIVWWHATKLRIRAAVRQSAVWRRARVLKRWARALFVRWRGRLG